MENILNSHLDTLLYKVSLPVLLMSSEDMEMFINEPVEYVLNPLDYMDSSLNPKKCMVNLI